ESRRDGGLPSFYCDPPRQLCNNFCVNVETARYHCGSCNSACGEGLRCRAGACTDAECAPEETDCDGSCVSTASDREHCGGCGLACAEGEACVDGACACPAGFERC